MTVHFGARSKSDAGGYHSTKKMKLKPGETLALGDWKPK